MSSPSREHLLGYLLGALERADQEQVESELDQNPALRAELDRLNSHLGQLGMDQAPRHFEPPFGLAVRTCQFVAARGQPVVMQAEAVAAQYGMDGQRRLSWSDFVVAAAVLVAAASLFFPALSSSRFHAQVAACQNHLRYVGFGLQQFSERQPDGSFPGPESEGNRAVAGVVAPILVGHGLVPGPRVFLCPSSQVVRRSTGFHMPTPEELDTASGAALLALQRTMGGDYGYNMGYTQEGKLVQPCNSRRSQYVLVADAPSNLQPKRVSSNHRGRGQNVLYEDGHVRFVVLLPSPHLPDDPYHNREGWVAAGLDCDDAVLGASADRPIPVPLIELGN